MRINLFSWECSRILSTAIVDLILFTVILGEFILSSTVKEIFLVLFLHLDYLQYSLERVGIPHYVFPICSNFSSWIICLLWEMALAFRVLASSLPCPIPAPVVISCLYQGLYSPVSWKHIKTDTTDDISYWQLRENRTKLMFYTPRGQQVSDFSSNKQTKKTQNFKKKWDRETED